MSYTTPDHAAVDFFFQGGGYTAPEEGTASFNWDTNPTPTPSPLPALKSVTEVVFHTERGHQLGLRQALPYKAAPSKDVTHGAGWATTKTSKDAPVQYPWDAFPHKDALLVTKWQVIAPNDNGVMCSWVDIPVKDSKLEVPYGSGVPTDVTVGGVWEHLVATSALRNQAKDVPLTQQWAVSDIYHKKGYNDFTEYEIPVWTDTDFSLSPSVYYPQQSTVDFALSRYVQEVLDLGIAPRDSRANQPFRLLSIASRRDQVRDCGLQARWGPGGTNFARDSVPSIAPWGIEIGQPGEGGDPIIIPVQQVYIVIHDISVIRQSDSFPIDAESVNLSLNADSWAWGFSAVLLGKDALDAVMPTAGEPVVLEVTVNGTTWHVMVEDWAENREFGKRSISVKGRGVSAELASPYELPESGVETSARTIQQLMDERLPLGSSWTVAWHFGMQDWLIPAGAYSWQDKSPIANIYAIASSVGMAVVPDPSSKTLYIQPRYPVLPWDFEATSADLIVPDSAILQLQKQQAIQTQANAVYIHGQETGGVLLRAYLEGTAGDKLAATHTSPLITQSDAAYVCGARILAQHYQQPEVRSVTLPMGGDMALGQIGQLLQVNVGTDDHKGVVNGVALNVTRSNVRQTLSMGETSPNKWAQFKRLTATSPLLMGEIATDHGDGTLTITLINSGNIRVKGAGTVGDSVWVRNHKIEGSAPSLTSIDIPV